MSNIKLTPLFCYGSNHIEQIRARVNNYTLTSYKCELPFYKRIFSGTANSWQNGGVASIVHTGEPIDSCRGSYVLLNEEEFKKMDKFEGIYSNNPYDKNPKINAYYRENVLIKIQNNQLINAIAYIKTDNTWINYPSNEYLKACYKNIKPFWQDLDGNNFIMIYDNTYFLHGKYTL
jgi:hypothetical protein